MKKVKERKEAKLNLESTRLERLKQRRRDEYNAKDAAEKAAENDRSKELYNLTKTIAGERKRQMVDVKDKQGMLKTETRERLQRLGRTLVKY